MFVKLLKQEWRAIREILGLLCIIILICGGLIGGVIHCIYVANAPDSVNATCLLLFMAGVVGVAVCCAGSIFLVLWRYYQGRFTDEGYLTFTLPVNQHQILLSSITISIIGIVLTILTALIAIAIAFGGYFLAVRKEVPWKDLMEALGYWWPEFRSAFREVAPELMELAAMFLTGGLSQLLILMLAITVGAVLARKHKILAAFFAYYGIHIIRTVVVIASAAQLETAFIGTSIILNLLLTLAAYGGMYLLIRKRLNLN